MPRSSSFAGRGVLCGALCAVCAVCACPSPAPTAREADPAEGEGEAAEGEGEAAVGEGEGEAAVGEGEGEGEVAPPTSPVIPRVFVIAMENKAEAGIYGNALAPFINDVLLPTSGSAAAYGDCLTSAALSEPHYVWLEAGTNTFDDHTFFFDGNPSANNSTADTNHLATQLLQQGAGRSWRSYQEGLDDSTGACPIHGSAAYAPKHDPFVFFKDVAGDPPDENNALCAAHHRAYTTASFQRDLAAGDVEAYTFITPDLCHDMHGKSSCTNGCTSSTAPQCISEGDAWLQENVPPIVDYITDHGGVLFIVWDEPEGNTAQPFFVIGPGVKPGHTSTVELDHSSYLKSLQRIFDLPVSARVVDANDFADFFVPGQFP